MKIPKHYKHAEIKLLLTESEYTKFMSGGYYTRCVFSLPTTTVAQVGYKKRYVDEWTKNERKQKTKTQEIC